MCAPTIGDWLHDMDEKQRRTIRLAGYDYAQGGAYFVTICARERKCVFGRVAGGAMVLNVYGEIVRDEWLKSAELRPGIVLDEFQIMPNHFHAVVIFDDANVTPHVAPTVGAHTIGAHAIGAHTVGAHTVGAHSCAPLQPPSLHRPARSLGSLMAQFKATVTRNISIYRTERGLAPVQVWQRNYFERIVRDERELNDSRRYIIENPLHWLTDENHPDQTKSTP